MNQEENELWYKFVEGEEKAFAQIYRQYSDMLFAYGIKIVNDDNIVDECIQNLFVYLYEKRKNIAIPNNIYAYLLVSLKRMLWKQQNKENKFISIEDAGTYEFDLSLDADECKERLDYKEELINKLNEAINMLSPQQREVIYLRYYKGLSVEETAEVVGVAKQTVMNVSATALKRLNKNMVSLKDLIIVLGLLNM